MLKKKIIGTQLRSFGHVSNAYPISVVSKKYQTQQHTILQIFQSFLDFYKLFNYGQGIGSHGRCTDPKERT